MSESDKPKKLPPYPPFKSFIKLMDALKVLVPPRLDGSYMTAQRFSGGLGGQVLTGCRFLGLVDGVEPTDPLKNLVKQSGDDWKRAFEKIIRTAYAPVFEMNLETCTDQMFRQRFRDVYGAEGEVASKVISFFMQACNKAGITLSPLIAKRVLSGASAVRRSRQRRPEPLLPVAAVATDNGAAPPDAITTVPTSPAEFEWAKFKVLVDKFPRLDPTWPDDLKARWFQAYEQFMAANIGVKVKD